MYNEILHISHHSGKNRVCHARHSRLVLQSKGRCGNWHQSPSHPVLERTHRIHFYISHVGLYALPLLPTRHNTAPTELWNPLAFIPLWNYSPYYRRLGHILSRIACAETHTIGTFDVQTILARSGYVALRDITIPQREHYASRPITDDVVLNIRLPTDRPPHTHYVAYKCSFYYMNNTAYYCNYCIAHYKVTQLCRALLNNYLLCVTTPTDMPLHCLWPHLIT